MPVIQAMPRLTRGKVSTPGEPVTASEADNRHQRVPDLIDHDDRGIGRRSPDRGLVEHHHLRELCEEQLLGAAELSALVALPIGDGDGFHRLCDGIRDRLLLLRRRNAELCQRIGLGLLVGAVVALNHVRYPESHELVKEGNFVEKEVDELVGVADVLTGGHVRGYLHALIEGVKSLLTLAAPELGEAALDRIAIVLFILAVAVLEVRDAEDRLEGCVDPAGSVLVAKSEHSLLQEG